MSDRDRRITRIISTPFGKEVINGMKSDSRPTIEVQDPYFYTEASVSKARVDFHIHNLSDPSAIYELSWRGRVPHGANNRAILRARTHLMLQLRDLADQLAAQIESEFDSS